MENNYIYRLKINMFEQGFSTSYIDKCCSYATLLISQSLPVIFDKNHLDQILMLDTLKLDCYHEFEIYTKGKSRIILAPSKPLKSRQRWILDEILNKLPTNQCCHGFVQQHSIKTNAEMHVNKAQVLCMDIHNFFPSINIDQVFEVFHWIGYTSDVAQALAQLCTHNGILPQGAPSSPALANIIFNPIDQQILNSISTKDITYTRYADDLIFSSSHEIDFLIPLISEIISINGFKINNDKTHLMKNPYRKMITGLIVTDTVKVPKYYKRKFNQELFYCEKYGVASHLKNCRTHKKVNFKEYMYGKAYYIKMIEPDLGEEYLRRLDAIRW